MHALWESAVSDASQFSREELIRLLCWNDRNGVYSDEDAIAEGFGPLTREEAGCLIRRAHLEGSAVDDQTADVLPTVLGIWESVRSDASQVDHIESEGWIAKQWDDLRDEYLRDALWDDRGARPIRADWTEAEVGRVADLAQWLICGGPMPE